MNMPATPPDPVLFRLIRHVVEELSGIVLGKEREIKLCLAGLMAKGHILIEDMPGVGKTTLAKGLSTILGLHFRRVQFTSDMLPSDIVGVSVFNRNSGKFEFRPGPVFTQVLLADELNRASPKAQSALLEAMEEGHVTVEGVTYPLDSPFFVIATQNPFEHSGTYPLPDSQLDRFMLRLSLGYPDRDAERELLKRAWSPQDARIEPILAPGQCEDIQAAVSRVHVAEAVITYVQDLVDFTREREEFVTGLSPRAGLALVSAFTAWAFIEQRTYVLPEDVRKVLPWVAGHRLRSTRDYRPVPTDELEDIFSKVPVP